MKNKIRLENLSRAQYLYVLIYCRCYKYFLSKIHYLEACHMPPVSHWMWRRQCRCPDMPQSWVHRRLGECPGGGTQSWTQRRRWEQLPAPQGCGRLPRAAASLRFQYAWQWSDLQQKGRISVNLSELLQCVWLSQAPDTKLLMHIGYFWIQKSENIKLEKKQTLKKANTRFQ